MNTSNDSVTNKRPDPQSVIGVDIGGANLKYASLDGQAFSRGFEMWKRSAELAEAIANDIAAMGTPDCLAITMTGELADCFVDRSEGVAFIVDACHEASKRLAGPIDTTAPACVFYGVDGRFHHGAQAKQIPNTIAAANWHALASAVASVVTSSGTLVDIGSTTTDIIPFADGRVSTNAMTDYDRLTEGSLVYVGCRRTPVCGLVHRLTLNGITTPVMNEWFATIDDARIVLGLEAQDDADCDSADGGPRTRDRAANRLLRMVGHDRKTMTTKAAEPLAQQIITAAKREINGALERVDSGDVDAPIVISGHGGDLLDVPRQRKVIDLGVVLGRDRSRCAPAWAVAERWTRLATPIASEAGQQ
ncbi:Hydantoinase/oxoprolinase [Rubripirellula lacrimiformis]|uniref:Hydantoinase/oxoprolinase n=1 Tax=Rubripirellula lacrimiformis TaxID=1930273 RepID=A0A517N9C4_9BACT|nr:hydantoinase/oxoprolinase family protein [Rubripirellula lacrimiformis]QDT03737.1 Hydantoinase/oxoprolinase [Rubripirellula lacrimiformis]